MLIEDTLELIRKLSEIHGGDTIKSNIEEVVDHIGGNPALIYRLMDYSYRYNISLDRALDYIRSHVYEDVLRKSLNNQKERVNGII